MSLSVRLLYSNIRFLTTTTLPPSESNFTFTGTDDARILQLVAINRRAPPLLFRSRPVGGMNVSLSDEGGRRDRRSRGIVAVEPAVTHLHAMQHAVERKGHRFLSRCSLCVATHVHPCCRMQTHTNTQVRYSFLLRSSLVLHQLVPREQPHHVDAHVHHVRPLFPSLPSFFGGKISLRRSKYCP